MLYPTSLSIAALWYPLCSTPGCAFLGGLNQIMSCGNPDLFGSVVSELRTDRLQKASRRRNRMAVILEDRERQLYLGALLLPGSKATQHSCADIGPEFG